MARETIDLKVSKSVEGISIAALSSALHEAFHSGRLSKEIVDWIFDRSQEIADILINEGEYTVDPDDFQKAA